MSKSSRKVKVLFVCVGNMIRSQISEGFARHRGSAFVEPYSAGIRHTGTVSQEAVHVMKEKGIDIGDHYSKGLGDVPLGEMDYIVNMSGYPNESVFPASLGAKFVTWQVGDPLGGTLEKYRKVRDEIERKVEDLLHRIWSESSGKKEG